MEGGKQKILSTPTVKQTSAALFATRAAMSKWLRMKTFPAHVAHSIPGPTSNTQNPTHSLHTNAISCSPIPLRCTLRVHPTGRHMSARGNDAEHVLPIGRGRHCRTHAGRHESAKGNDVYTSSSTSRGTTLVECPVHKCDSSRDAGAAATITTSCSALEASARDSHQVWHSEPSAN